MLSSVDLPQPDGPRMQTNSPGRVLNVAFSTARHSALRPLRGNTLVTFVSLREVTSMIASRAPR